MSNECIENLIKRYGEPILRFKPHGEFTHDQRMTGDIPIECAVFKIEHISELIVYENYGNNRWYANGCIASRFVIKELLRRLKDKK